MSQVGGTVEGTKFDDCIFGTSGDDTIIARGGNDVIVAGGGKDLVYGGAGDVSYYPDKTFDGEEEIDGSSKPKPSLDP